MTIGMFVGRRQQVFHGIFACRLAHRQRQTATAETSLAVHVLRMPRFTGERFGGAAVNGYVCFEQFGDRQGVTGDMRQRCITIYCSNPQKL